MDRIYLRTSSQAALFEAELKGQFSDGYWENRPGDHWQPWCQCQAEVGTAVGRDFPAHIDRYALDNKALLSVVGDRMLVIGRLSLAGFSPMQIRSMQDLWDTARYDRETETWSGLTNPSPKWVDLPTHTGPYWDQLRAELSLLDLARARLAVEDTAYGYKELRADLREIKVAMRTRVNQRPL